MENSRVNVCRFCLSSGIKLYQLKDCLKPPMHVLFDGTTELQNAMEKILKNDACEDSKDVCIGCNDKFQQIYTFLDRCSKNILAPVENTVERVKKPMTIADRNSIEQNSKLSTLSRKEGHTKGTGAESCEEDSQILKFKEIKKAVVRLKRLKMMTFTVKVTSECDINFCCTTGYSRVKNDSDRNAYEANIKDSEVGECPEIEDIKSEILEDIHTENYQAIETSNASESLVQKVLPKEESISLAYTSHSVLSSDQSEKELHRVSKLNQSPNVWKQKHRTSYQCDRCEKYFSNIFRLNGHREIYSGKGFECDQYKGFLPTERHFRKHVMRRHEIKERLKCDNLISPGILKDHQTPHTGKTAQCDQCGASFYTRRMLLSHKFKDHSNVRYKCDQCEKNFSCMKNLRYHKQLHAGIIFDCDQCEKVFGSKSHLRAHQKLHTGIVFDCDNCDAKFSTSSYLRKHKLNMHSGLRKRYKCEQCEKELSSYVSLRIHRRLHTGETFNCSQCDERFTMLSALQKHLNKCEQKNYVAGDGTSSKLKNAIIPVDKSMVTVNCFSDVDDRAEINKESTKSGDDSNEEWLSDDTFDKEIVVSSVEDHSKARSVVKLSQHSNVKFCDAKFTRKDRMLAHRQIHPDEPFYCSQCDEHFTQRSELQIHKCVRKNHMAANETHTNKRYKCDQCRKDFSSVVHLKEHQELHTGNILDCSLCGAKFPSRYFLQKHKRKMHYANPLRQYNCEQCEKIFSTSVSLNRHRLAIHQNAIFPCDLCEKKFRYKYSMLMHRRIHTGETFDCQQCDMRFTQRWRLRVHITKYCQKMVANETLKT